MVTLLLIALLAALLAVALGAGATALKLPGWLVKIIEYAALLAFFVWLQRLL